MADENLDIWVKISQQIGELNSAIKQALDRITNHESRITILEKHTWKNTEQKDWKTDLLMWLAKTLLVGAVGFSTLAGAGSILGKIFNVN